jgi:prevent-host-death family protein
MWSHVTTKMGIRELRDTLTQAIRRVRAGETIEVTHDGEPVALITPYPRSRLDELIASGRVTPAKRPLHPLPKPLPVTGPKTASEALEEDRSSYRW